MKEQANKTGNNKSKLRANYIAVILCIAIGITIVIILAPELGVLGTIAASISTIGYIGVFAMIMLVE